MNKKVPFNISLAKKKQGKSCCAYGCNNEPVYKKGGLCHKHYKRKRRALDPVGVRYNMFKTNALKRNKDFEISLEEFRNFCKETGYIINKGYRGFAATIDRIDNSKGYSMDNIQIMSMMANINKYNNHDVFQDVPF